MKKVIETAFKGIRDGYSVDRVVADPFLNGKFISQCRQLGLDEPAVQLNKCLLNLRKASSLSGQKTTRYTRFPNRDEYQFASEIAIRHLERKNQTTLDDIICDPKLASEFDTVASSIAPGFSPLEYRWAALYLRKTANLKPELISRIAPDDFVEIGGVDQLDLPSIPKEQGLYLFFDHEEVLYAGEAKNLRTRIKKHMKHSDNRGLARWLWEHGSERLRLEIHVLPSNTSRRARRALEIELINSRRPVFNIRDVNRRNKK